MRFESSLYFGNVERFRSALVQIAGCDPNVQQQQGTRKEVKLGKNNADDDVVLLENEFGEPNGSDEKIANGVRHILRTCYHFYYVFFTLFWFLTCAQFELN